MQIMQVIMYNPTIINNFISNVIYKLLKKIGM